MPRLVGILFLTLAAACSSSTGSSNLSFVGRSTVSPTPPMDVQAVVTVRNVGDKGVRINLTNCQPLSAYSTPERNGTPVWQSQNPEACALILMITTLAPGESVDFNFAGTIPSSLPAGTYYLTANVNGTLVAAGEFQK